MKRKTICILIFLTLFFLTACGSKKALDGAGGTGYGAVVQPPASDPADPIPPDGDANPPEDSPSADEAKSPSLFTRLPAQYGFSSGAGAWSTELTLAEDGTFTGLHSDSDMGDMDEALYPNGTVYTCSFSGRFSEPEKIDEHTYTMRMESLTAEGTEGETVYEDGIRWITSSPYGLENAEEVLIYFPGTRIDSLPEDIMFWLIPFMYDGTPEKLPFYVLCNVSEGYAFVSYGE